MTKPQPNITCTNCGYSWNTKSKLILVSCPSCKHNITNISIPKLFKKGNMTNNIDNLIKQLNEALEKQTNTKQQEYLKRIIQNYEKLKKDVE